MIEWIIIFVLLYLVSQTIYINVYEKRIRNVRGPFLYPLVSTVPNLLVTDYGDWLGICFKKYGDTFVTCHRVIFWGLYQRNLIVTRDPKVVAFFNSNLDIFCRVLPGEHTETRIVKKLFGDGIFFSDGDVWRFQRNIARPMFKKDNINKMKQTFLEKSEIVLQILGKLEKSGSHFNAIELFSSYTLDSFCKVGFGVEINSLLNKVPFQTAFDEAIKFSMNIFIDPMAKYTQKKKFESNLEVIDNYLYELIENNSGNGTDLLSNLKNTKDDNGIPVPKKWLRDILCNFLIAGRDTTSLLITWTFYNLALNPSIEKKLVEELKQECTGPLPSEEALMNCKYLDMVINETLRCYPSVPNVYRTATRNVTLPDGTKVRKGDGVAYSQFYMHHNPQYWDNPEQYKPERWQDKKLLSNPSFIPFHSGEMQCLGRYMAKTEAKALIAAILLHYHLELAPGEKVTPFQGLLLTVSSLKMTVQPQLK